MDLRRVLYIFILSLMLSAIFFYFLPLMKKLFQKSIMRKKKIELKEKVSLFAGDEKRSYVKRELSEIQQMLKYSGKENQYRVIQLLSVLLAAVGIAIALIMNNPFLVPIAGIIFAAAPFLYVKLINTLYKKKINRDLDSSLSLITNTYMNRNDIVSSISDNIPYLAPSIKPFFQEFLVDNAIIDASVISSINKLKLKINNPIFHAWCDCLKQCQRDATVKNNLGMIVKQFSEDRNIQQEVDAVADGAKRNSFFMLAMVTLFPFLIKMINKEWFAVYNTTSGKIGIAVTVVIVAISLWQIIVLSQPVDNKKEE